jgi:hypothetical protein
MPTYLYPYIAENTEKHVFEQPLYSENSTCSCRCLFSKNIIIEINPTILLLLIINGILIFFVIFKK